ncbi:hypothetical protein B0H17DRAFT_1078815 [Mycena rosella]|uniref:Uncharacterized protein n=1 Tax=Mycena rosella TaxID=1033263 RepID=A0AAD7D449_MYCRO|nr:hypothetical protein B0H17DRAFT_1078815 [Mycena rosella]
MRESERKTRRCGTSSASIVRPRSTPSDVGRCDCCDPNVRPWFIHSLSLIPTVAPLGVAVGARTACRVPLSTDQRSRDRARSSAGLVPRSPFFYTSARLSIFFSCFFGHAGAGVGLSRPCGCGHYCKRACLSWGWPCRTRGARSCPLGARRRRLWSGSRPRPSLQSGFVGFNVVLGPMSLGTGVVRSSLRRNVSCGARVARSALLARARDSRRARCVAEGELVPPFASSSMPSSARRLRVLRGGGGRGGGLPVCTAGSGGRVRRGCAGVCGCLDGRGGVRGADRVRGVRVGESVCVRDTSFLFYLGSGASPGRTRPRLRPAHPAVVARERVASVGARLGADVARAVGA